MVRLDGSNEVDWRRQRQWSLAKVGPVWRATMESETTWRWVGHMRVVGAGKFLCFLRTNSGRKEEDDSCIPD